MAVSKVILNGTTLMDVTQKTVTSGNMLSGITSLKNDGTDITGNIATKTSTDMTVSGATVTTPAGYYASNQSKSVASGTAGTPTATKGTVSNHSVTVTPSVTNTTGYITGGTKSGTAVTVTASELDSGTKSITENGTGIDVVGYAAVDVAVPSTPAYKLVVTGSNDSGCYVTYDTVKYYSGDDFAFNPGDTCTIRTRARIGGIFIYVDGVSVYSDPYGISYTYTYTLPSHNVEVEILYDTSGEAYVTPYTIEITSNGEYDVTDYAVADVDVPSTTVESLSVTQNGTYTAPTGKAYTPVTVNVSGGGSAAKALNFIDYDGTIVNSYTVQEAQALSELPANPSHTGLTAQGWNWSLADIKSYLTKYPDGIVNVGQMYITASGATEIDVTFDNPDFLSPYLAIAPNGTVVVDWGDGSATDTVTGSGMTTLVYQQHVYLSVGSYTIKLTVSSGSFSFYGAINYSSVLRTSSTVNNRIRNRTYSGCITAIRLGSSVGISSYAFQYCYSLTSITIPDGVTSIGSSAFQYCYALTSITIPDGVTSIGGNAFQYCYALTSITIPDGVTSIGNSAFQNCYSLTSITIPDGVTSIGGNVFYSCYSLTSITIPDGVTSIGSSAFQNCYSLTSITIPDSVTSIGSSTFNSCYSLTSITIPDGVTSIGGNAFQYCYALTSITIPDGVTSIGTYTFGSCFGLTSITVPDGVTSIGGNAFQYCYAIEEYHFLSTTPPTLANTNALNGIMSGTIIYVPAASLEAYQTATNWSTYASYMVGE